MMLSRLSTILMVAGVLTVSLLSGCGSSADLSLKLSADDTASYKSVKETVKLFKFDQPNLGKLKEEETKTLTEMDFTQMIQAVDADGNATAQVTIDGLKVVVINKNETRLSFDSQDEKDQDSPLAKLLGKSYTIEINSAGEVKALDTKDVTSTIKSDYEKKIAKGLFDKNSIADRHQIAGLPKDGTDGVSIEDTWSVIAPSPPGLLAPKSYEKTYTLTSIDGNTATVQMAGTESGETVKGGSQPAGGMGIFAKMFDNQDDYTGTLKFDLESGKVVKSNETLISTYTAQEMPENGNPEKGPDVLTMQFINRIQIEKLN
jgi:hypothetical protein